ncbi:MAG: SMP-30/gluconolactonase/LRE family protein, partial [Caldilineaceae bacterium]|nr:SMP-30/gluconolactonase/LRE family protein [Caldilineaceae bacterium]
GLRLLAVGLAGLLLVLTIRTSFTLTYINYDMATEFLVYAHAGPDVKRALAEIDTISERTVGDRNIQVAYDNETSWPLSWYMIDYPNSRYYGDAPGADIMTSPVIIVGSENYDKVHPYVTRDYVKRTYRLIWWPDQGYFNRTWQDVWNALRDPQQRENIWQIVFYRRYVDVESPSGYRDLTQWPTRDNFEMWVRRDIAEDIWDLGVAPVAGGSMSQAAVLRESEIDLPAAAVYDNLYAGLALNHPRGVAVDEQGLRYIADTLNHRIVVVDAAGNEVRTFGSFCDIAQGEAGGCIDPDGSGPLQLGDGQFNEPWSVGVSRDGSAIFVADTWNHRIQVFDGQGQFLRKWGRFDGVAEVPGDPNALYGPRGLAVDLDGNLLVADTGNKRIIRYTPEGQGLEQAGGGGVIPGAFNEPTGVGVDPRNGDVFVADNWNRRIQKFTSALLIVEEWPVPSWETQQRDDKPSIAVDLDGRVYVTDPTMYRVIVYSPAGEIVSSFGTYGTAANQLTFPNGIVIDWQTNQALVADADSGRVLAYPVLP